MYGPSYLGRDGKWHTPEGADTEVCAEIERRYKDRHGVEPEPERAETVEETLATTFETPKTKKVRVRTPASLARSERIAELDSSPRACGAEQDGLRCHLDALHDVGLGTAHAAFVVDEEGRRVVKSFRISTESSRN
jgi:hypothetical protein